MNLQITYRQLGSSPALSAAIERSAAELAALDARITSCRTVIELHERRPKSGRRFRVRIQVKVGGKLIDVGRTAAQDEHADPAAAVRAAFSAARRRLEDVARRRARRVERARRPMSHGHVRMISWCEGFGFIATSDRPDVFFHKNAVTRGAFESLDVGQRVRFSLHEGQTLAVLQASAVERVSRR